MTEPPANPEPSANPDANAPEQRDLHRKHYSNGEITIVWQPQLCTHSTLCWRGLPRVFNPRHRPWVHPEGADTQTIVAQVERCPSGALSYFWNDRG